jgi:hypothetical protein
MEGNSIREIEAGLVAGNRFIVPPASSGAYTGMGSRQTGEGDEANEGEEKQPYPRVHGDPPFAKKANHV